MDERQLGGNLERRLTLDGIRPGLNTIWDERQPLKENGLRWKIFFMEDNIKLRLDHDLRILVMKVLHGKYIR